MSHTTSRVGNQSEHADPLDRLLSDYFQQEMRMPWPPAPVIARNEPSRLVAERGPSRSVVRDSGRSARSTLLIAAALLLGSCWYLSQGFAPNPTHSVSPGPAVGSNLLGGATAGKPAVLEELRKEKATHGNATGKTPAVKLP